MKEVDSSALHNRYHSRPEIVATELLEKEQRKERARLGQIREAKDFKIAQKCEHFALDTEDAPCLWHRSYCLHPDMPDPEESGTYETCTLVWNGTCCKCVIK